MSSNLTLSWLTVTAVVAALASIAAHYLAPADSWLRFTFKPVATTLVLAVALLPGTFLTSPYAAGICVGLLSSLIGDIFLMWPATHFQHGLLSFLVAHLCYWFAFGPGAFNVNALPLLAVMAVLTTLILHLLWPGVPRRLRIPIGVFTIAITGTATLAFSRHLQQPSRSSTFAIAGALLLLASDAALAIDRFRKPFPLARLVIRSTYYAGQLLIAWSVPLNVL